MYDDFVWMQKFGDPLFHRHVAAATILGLVALKLADEEFLPFDYISYASELQQSAKVLENDFLGKPELESKDWLSKWKKDPLKVRELNDRLMMTERAFTDRAGLFERPWYKHMIYGPSQHNGYGSKSFPGIYDAVEKAETSNTSYSWQSVQHEVWRVARVITQASHVLKGELT